MRINVLDDTHSKHFIYHICTYTYYIYSPHIETNLIYTLTTPTAADESQIVEFGHLILHHRRTVAQLGAPVLVVARVYRDHRAVAHVRQRHHLEGDRQRFVAAPVLGQLRAKKVRACCAYYIFMYIGRKKKTQLFSNYLVLRLYIVYIVYSDFPSIVRGIIQPINHYSLKKFTYKYPFLKWFQLDLNYGPGCVIICV